MRNWLSNRVQNASREIEVLVDHRSNSKGVLMSNSQIKGAIASWMLILSLLDINSYLCCIELRVKNLDNTTTTSVNCQYR